MRRGERISMRVSTEMKAAWEQAAAANGVTLAEFIRSSSQQAADAILQPYVLRLSARDSLVFAEALRHPPAPNEKLLAAMARHRDLVGQEEADHPPRPSQ
jgi:uncharacterized protein (DUF1778 family)